MFSNLTDALDKSFRNLAGTGKISEENIFDALREVRLALLEADVEFSVAKTFIERVREKALGADVLKSVKPGEQIIKIFQDELADFLGVDAGSVDGSRARAGVGTGEVVDLQALVDADHLQAEVARHCGGLVSQWFPEQA